MKQYIETKFFDIEENVKEYIEMCEGMDCRDLIEILKEYLKPNSTVLELGMGSGKDLDILNEFFNATGSDNSRIFLDIYKKRNPQADLLHLDAVTLETNRKFDCIFSNKVLHHLSRENLIKSFIRQNDLLNDNGIIFHTFWFGEQETSYQDLKFIQYKQDELLRMTDDNYKLLSHDTYDSIGFNDSFNLILSKK